MKYPETARRLREAISDANMIPQELADRSGVSKSSISQYLNGSHKPSNLSSGRMANVLGVDPVWLMGLSDTKTKPTDTERLSAAFDHFNETHPNLPSYEEMSLVLAYRKASDKDKARIIDIANRYAEISEIEQENSSNIKRYAYFRHIAAAGTGIYLDDVPTDTMEAPYMAGADYIIGVSGDSMEPTYHDGDDVYVQKATSLSEGDIGIFIVNNNCYIKEVGPDSLISHNSKYKPIPSGTSEIRCIGKVLGTVRQ